MFRTALTSVLALSTLVAIPAIAAPSSTGIPTSVVHYADLDLSHGVGVAALQRRIKASVELVCGDANPRDLAGVDERDACRRAASASSAAQVALVANHARELAARTGGTQIASR